MRSRLQPSNLSQLSDDQRRDLSLFLRNESDVAFRRRVWTMLRYLELRPGLKVLDCGTGMGFYTMVVKGLWPSCLVYGIDRDMEMLDYAAQHLPQKGSLLSCADAHSLPFAEGSFDRVILSEVLEHLKDDARGLAEVWRVLKPGGILALTVPYHRYPYWYDPINRLAESLVGRPIRKGPFAGIWANHERLYTESQLRSRIEDAGFPIEIMERMTHYCFPATQTIVYTFGKGLIERGLLPKGINQSVHRFRGTENSENRLNIFNWALAVFDWFDHWNEDPKRLAEKETFVNLAVKARKR